MVGLAVLIYNHCQRRPRSSETTQYLGHAFAATVLGLFHRRMTMQGIHPFASSRKAQVLRNRWVQPNRYRSAPSTCGKRCVIGWMRMWVHHVLWMISITFSIEITLQLYTGVAVGKINLYHRPDVEIWQRRKRGLVNRFYYLQRRSWYYQYFNPCLWLCQIVIVVAAAFIVSNL